MYVFYVLFDVCKCDVFVCFDACGVFVVVECSLFRLSECCSAVYVIAYIFAMFLYILHFVKEKTLSIGIVLDDLAVLLSMCSL